MDCMEYMKTLPDNAFDLAVVDPPYGIGMDGGKLGSDNKGRCTNYTKKDWDNSAPTGEYFYQLMRTAKNQIIFGAKHFISKIPFDSSCWIVWDKDNTGKFADCELAWTSFPSAVRLYRYRWNGMLQENMANKEKRIHPTQKPVGLYRWIYKNYAKPGMKILDTHLGSGSSRIAAWDAGLDFVGTEIDEQYFKMEEERFAKHIAQGRLFDNPLPSAEQTSLF